MQLSAESYQTAIHEKIFKKKNDKLCLATTVRENAIERQ